MKVLITGSFGFIGSHLCTYLCNKGWNIFSTDIYAYSGRNGPDGLDITVPKDVQSMLAGASEVDYIVHLAAETNVYKSMGMPGLFAATNFMGTYNLLESIRDLKGSGLLPNLKKILIASTDEVYGTMGPGEYATEETKFNPTSPYAGSKAAADCLAQAYHKAYGLPIVITRSCNNYGPRQTPDKLIPKTIRMLKEGLKIPLFGDGSQIREWVHVRDHCRAIELLLEHGEIGEAYNVGTGYFMSNLQIINAIAGFMGIPVDRETHFFVPDHKGNDKRYAVDWSKLSRLGWQPQIDFGRGLKETIDKGLAALVE